MTRIIIVDNCTQCPYYYRFQDPKLGRICFRVRDFDKETKRDTYRPLVTPRDETPEWCPLPEKIERKDKAEKAYRKGKKIDAQLLDVI